MRRGGVIATVGVLAAAAAGAAALALNSTATAPPDTTAPTAANGHTFLHIGCKNHNHGPKWHAGHGRSAMGDRRGSASDAAGDEADALTSRRLTAGR